MDEKKAQKFEIAAFGAGCFWGVEETFRKIDGVIDTKVGYMGGNSKNPNYRDVCSGETGHAEVVKITYDKKKVSYEKLLEVFWESHDPTTRNRQGPDVGEQYRSVIFYYTPEQKRIAEKKKKELEKSGKFKRKIVTQVVKAPMFYKAEEYHQRYLQKKGLNVCH